MTSSSAVALLSMISFGILSVQASGDSSFGHFFEAQQGKSTTFIVPQALFLLPLERQLVENLTRTFKQL